MARYLVTGGAGFIGSHIVDRLRARGDEVRILDDFSRGKRENIPQGVEVVEGSVADLETAQRAVAACDFVIHQAAIPSVPRSVKDPVSSNRANVDGTLNILVAARDAGVKRLVFAGSSSVYGESAVLPKREDMRPAPLSPYALQKLIGEQYCQMFTRLYGLETVTTRYFNVFGPRQQPGSPYSGVISLFIEALAQGKAPMVHGDGRQTRDFTFVADAVSATVAAATRGKPGGVYNIGGGSRVELLDVFELIRRVTRQPVKPDRIDSQRGDMRDTYADTTRARADLGFAPTVTLEQGLRAQFDWMQNAGLFEA